ncbi:hypothetical protein PG985_008261 [Apiospora marii]|uniref:uncharacterized protein n=1 Tax=Apiospora marii TaxID=335849 RepID=UPI00312EF427
MTSPTSPFAHGPVLWRALATRILSITRSAIGGDVGGAQAARKTAAAIRLAHSSPSPNNCATPGSNNGNAGGARATCPASVQEEYKKTKTYNTEDSQVVTDPSTNSALCCLYMGERTGSLVFSRIWSVGSWSSCMKACAEHSRGYQQPREAEAAMNSSVLGSDAY